MRDDILMVFTFPSVLRRVSIVEFFNGFDTRVTQHVPLVEQEVLVYPSRAS
jgi:hypothetical protein